MLPRLKDHGRILSTEKNINEGQLPLDAISTVSKDR
ncbi:MAG: hypothetical protein ACI89D_000957 [Bermanella sp.]|jgi:hypothetical protein